jgi:hypothetical protein
LNKQPLGWAEITHPFHPYRGKRYSVLKVRRVAEVDILSLRAPSGGTYPVPRDWTDLADPSPLDCLDIPPLYLSLDSLLLLTEIVETSLLTKKKKA